MASTPACTARCTVPRQPACTAPTTGCVRSARRIGAQSAVRTAITTSGSSLTMTSASGVGQRRAFAAPRDRDVGAVHLLTSLIARSRDTEHVRSACHSLSSSAQFEIVRGERGDARAARAAHTEHGTQRRWRLGPVEFRSGLRSRMNVVGIGIDATDPPRVARHGRRLPGRPYGRVILLTAVAAVDRRPQFHRLSLRSRLNPKNPGTRRTGTLRTLTHPSTCAPARPIRRLLRLTVSRIRECARTTRCERSLEVLCSHAHRCTSPRSCGSAGALLPPAMNRAGMSCRPHHRSDTMTIKIRAEREGQSAGQAGGRGAAFHGRAARRAEADWLRHLGAQSRQRPQRHLPGAPVLGQRRAAQLRPAPADGGRHRAGADSRTDPAGVPGARGGGGRRV